MNLATVLPDGARGAESSDVNDKPALFDLTPAEFEYCKSGVERSSIKRRLIEGPGLYVCRFHSAIASSISEKGDGIVVQRLIVPYRPATLALM